MRRSLPALAVLVPAVLIAAGCGSSSSSAGSPNSSAYSGGAAKSTAAAKTTAAGATVATRKTALGTILVDSTGQTLYLFEKDKGDKSTCSGACAGAWPPLTTTAKPKPAGGIAAAKLGTSMRGDGTTEVTYGGHPLYTYAGDTAPGATTGQGVDAFGAGWYVVSPSGTKVEKPGS
jgi:predicted lipoprotein with Yx(FWY)xxD motif